MEIDITTAMPYALPGVITDISAMAEETRLLYDRKTAAQQLSISVRSLDAFIAAKKIAFRRIGRRVLIPHGELVKFSRADHFEIPNDIAA